MRVASPMDRHVGAYYMRLMVQDRPGVIAAAATGCAAGAAGVTAAGVSGAGFATNIAVATTESWKDKTSGEKKEFDRVRTFSFNGDKPTYIAMQSFPEQPAAANGATPGGWVRYARELESAGASTSDQSIGEAILPPPVAAVGVKRAP